MTLHEEEGQRDIQVLLAIGVETLHGDEGVEDSLNRLVKRDCIQIAWDFVPCTHERASQLTLTIALTEKGEELAAFLRPPCPDPGAAFDWTEEPPDEDELS